MTEKKNTKTDTLEVSLLDDGTVLTLRAATTIPEQRREKTVADAQVDLEPVVAEARRIVVEVQRRQIRDSEERRALDALNWGRIVVASGSGARARAAYRVQRLLQQLRDVRVDGLIDIPARVASLTTSQVREQLPASLRQEVAWARTLPEAWDSKMAEVRRLARELAAGPMREVDTVEIKVPKPQRPTTAEATFNPLA
jgi:hypothetical protein